MEKNFSQKFVIPLKILTSVALVQICGGLNPARSESLGNQCRFLFENMTQTALSSFDAIALSPATSSLYMATTVSERSSTTGNRVERKATLKSTTIDQLLHHLETRLQSSLPNFALTSRDPQLPGFKNITATRYWTKLKIQFEGQNLTAKIRVRKYGLTADAKPATPQNFTPNSTLQDPTGAAFSWLEFKIAHPEFENAVLKPRIQVHDRNLELLTKPEVFLAQKERILTETLALNLQGVSNPAQVEKTQALVSQMLAALSATMIDAVPLRPISDTLYARTSYVVNLQNTLDNSMVNIQITVDGDIHQYSSVLGLPVNTYDPNSALGVIEIKIPVQYSQLSPQDLLNVPGLEAIKNLIEELQRNQAPGYIFDRGKFGLVGQILRLELEEVDGD